MPLLKLSLTNEEMTRLEELAREEDLSLQDYIRYTIFGDRNPAKFTPEEAERRAVEKYTADDEPFTLPDIYQEEWSELNPRIRIYSSGICRNDPKWKESNISY